MGKRNKKMTLQLECESKQELGEMGRRRKVKMKRKQNSRGRRKRTEREDGN